MHIPIVMVAFGTTSRALDTYSYIDGVIRDRFQQHEVLWAYSSRMVKHRLKKEKNIRLKHPHQVLTELSEKGYPWAVVQSLHLIAGHEFYRLISEAGECGIRSSIGLPLLSSPDDYAGVITALQQDMDDDPDTAVVLAGHGTDHPGWASYLALAHMFRQSLGRRIFPGSVDGYPEKEDVVEDVKKAGFRKVCLVPFMLVAGVHFFEDLTGEEDSWQAAFEQAGFSVSVKEKGIGMNNGIIDIFSRHIQDAIDVIPGIEPCVESDI